MAGATTKALTLLLAHAASVWCFFKEKLAAALAGEISLVRRVCRSCDGHIVTECGNSPVRCQNKRRRRVPCVMQQQQNYNCLV